MKQTLLVFLFFSFFLNVFAQNVEFTGQVNATGLLYNGENSPFWFHSNQRGRIDELTNFSGLISTHGFYNLSENSNLEFGLGALYQDGFADIPW